MKVVWSELKQRRVVQIAVSYVAIGWIGLNVADQLADRGIIPELFYRITLIWYIFGIPAALLIGWHHGEKGRQKAPLSEISLLIMLVVMASGMSVSSVAREREEAELEAARANPLVNTRVAVTYFDDLTDGEYRFLADGLTEDLITQLSQVSGLSVVSRNGVLQYRDAGLRPDSLARVLQVGTIVEGEVERRRGRLVVQVRLLQGSTGATIRRHIVELPPDEALAARDSVAEATTRLLRHWLGEETRVTLSAAGTRIPGAWTLLQQGERAFKDANAAHAAGDADQAAALFDQADSLFAEAATVDAAWDEPVISRAAVAYRRARLAQRDPTEAVRLVELTIRHADEALARSNTAARAYELRGTASYFRWLLRVASSTAEQDALLASAKTDLLSATQFDQRLASAHATLSHLYASEGDITSGVLSAQKAYETDMFLESAELVLWRLFNGTLEQGSFARAQQWCDEGRRRFPGDYRLQSCSLRLMVTPHVREPEIDEAWRLAAQVEELAPEPRRERQRVQNELLVAGVIARVGTIRNRPPLADSARAVLTRAAALVTPQLDPTRELLAVEAYSWILLGERDRAATLIQQHAAADPQHYSSSDGVAWWWRDIEGHPRFRAAMGLP